MARTRALDYDDKQDAILEAAARAIAEQGYPTTSMNDLAEACGVSKGRIYYYFESKEAILHEILTRHVEELAEACEEIIAGEPDATACFRALVARVLEIYAVSRDKHVILMTSLRYLPPPQREEIQERERRLVRLVGGVLERIAEAAGRPLPHPRVTTMLLFGMVNWTYTWFRSEGPASVEALTEEVCGLLLDGLRGGGAAG